MVSLEWCEFHLCLRRGNHKHAELHIVSGLRTFSNNPRIICNLRTLGLLAIVALGLSIAGGLLGSRVAPTQGEIGFILRRVSSGIYGGLYLSQVLMHFGAWSYRWHLKIYRRRVSYPVTFSILDPTHGSTDSYCGESHLVWYLLASALVMPFFLRGLLQISLVHGHLLTQYWQRAIQLQAIGRGT